MSARSGRTQQRDGTPNETVFRKMLVQPARDLRGYGLAKLRRDGLAGLTVGYGLEPFLSQEALDHALDLARPHLEKEDFPAAVLTILNALSQLLEGVCRELSDMLGLEQKFVLVQEPGEY